MIRQDCDLCSNLLFHVLLELDAQPWTRSGSVCTPSLLRSLVPLSNERRAKAALLLRKDGVGFRALCDPASQSHLYKVKQASKG